MSKLETTIHITEDSLTIESVNAHGIRNKKNTSLEAIQNVLNSEARLDTGLLPGPWGTQRYIRRGTREHYIVTTPPTIRTIKYDYDDEIREYTIPIPAAAWFFDITLNPVTQARKLRDTRVFALKGAILTGQEALYRMPFSNIGSTICWGSSSDTPVITTGKSITSIPTQFFNNPFNNDLSDSRFSRFNDTRKGKEGVVIFKPNHLFEWLDYHLKEAQKKGETFEFPLEHLVSESNLSSMTSSIFGL